MSSLENGNDQREPISRGIPMRRVIVQDPSHMPSHYSETPGGTLFSTTPGGTRIIYERKFLLDLKNSPLSKTPTKLPVIPGVTLDDSGRIIEEEEEANENEKNKVNEKQAVPMEEHNGNNHKKGQDDFQFDMDI